MADLTPAPHDPGSTILPNGHGKKAVIGALTHKLAHLIYSVIHTDKPFDSHYFEKELAIQDGIWP